MKPKELPASIFHTARLLLTPVDALGADATETDETTIISLTSIESRLNVVHITIRSLLSQDLSPAKIILWLHKDLETKIPKALSKLVSPHFEIAYTEEHCSHRKLVEPLKKLPQFNTVTCDDDVIYAKNWLRRLIDQHRVSPEDIVAHECRVISLDQNGTVLPYSHWQSQIAGKTSADTLSIGYGGVFYPAGVMPSQTTESKLYSELAPRADDLWFKAMSYTNGKSIRRTRNPKPKPTPILFSQRISLKSKNVKEDGNRTQWCALAKYFSIDFKFNTSLKPRNLSETKIMTE